MSKSSLWISKDVIVNNIPATSIINNGVARGCTYVEGSYLPNYIINRLSNVILSNLGRTLEGEARSRDQSRSTDIYFP